jgi:hypothetical protein
MVRGQHQIGGNIMSRGYSGRTRGRYRYGGYQENDRVQAAPERDSYFGSWDGNPDSVPGRLNADDTPDMRDARNREEFLGEKLEDRAFQRVVNFVRGAIRDGIDPEEIIEVAQEHMGDQSGGRGRRQDRSGGRQGDRGEDPIRKFQSIHEREEDTIREMRDILSRGGRVDWQTLDEICNDARRLNSDEYNAIKQLGESGGRRLGSLIQDVEEANSKEFEIIEDLESACERGDARKVEDLSEELEQAGREEAEVFAEIQDAQESGRRDRSGYSRRSSRQDRGSSSDERQTQSGRPDMRYRENRQRELGRRGMSTVHDRSRGGDRPRNLDGSLDLRDPRNREEYVRERSGRR